MDVNRYFLIAYTVPGVVHQSAQVTQANDDYILYMETAYRGEGFRVAVANSEPLAGMNIRDLKSVPIINFLKGDM